MCFFGVPERLPQLQSDYPVVQPGLPPNAIIAARCRGGGVKIHLRNLP